MTWMKFKRVANMLSKLPRDVYYTLNGWRFDDVKNYIKENGPKNINRDEDLISVFDLTHDYQGISERNPEFAMVTCLPPDETGIAIYSLRHMMASEVEVDVFSSIKNFNYFLRNRALLREKTGGKARLFSINSFLALESLKKYKKIIFVLGNSDHHVDVYRSLEELANIDSIESAYVYLHDPCCHNIIEKGKGLTSYGYADYLANLYSVADDLSAVASDVAPWLVHAEAVKRHIYGVRSLVDLGVRKFIVNSDAAKSMLIKDLPLEMLSFVDIKKIYHPIFGSEEDAEKLRSQEKTSKRLTIGTFGGAGNGKLTDVVMESVRELRARGKDADLIVAGYGAEAYVKQFFMGEIPSWIHCFEPKTDEIMQKLMARCDVAIQLRRESLGESSGVVPLLLKYRVPTIVSSVGAFVEYEGAVTVIIENNVNAIIDVIEKGDFPTLEKMQNYTQARSLINFEKQFRELLSE